MELHRHDEIILQHIIHALQFAVGSVLSHGIRPLLYTLSLSIAAGYITICSSKGVANNHSRGWHEIFWKIPRSCNFFKGLAKAF